jgi:hypothetical protein
MKECCSEQKCCCPCHSQQEECHSHHHCHSEAEEKAGDYFLDLADRAWGEVLKEKIKEHILATQNDRMAELAKIVAEGNNQRWKNKMEKKRGCAEMQEKLCHFFSHSKK